MHNIEKRKSHIDAIESCDEKVKGFERMKRIHPRNAPLYTAQIQMTKLEKEAAEKKLPGIQKKLKSIGLETPEKVTTYIRELTERKVIVEDQIQVIESDKDSIIRELKREQLEQKAASPSFADEQAALVQSIMGNLRPMTEVEAEIRKERGEVIVMPTGTEIPNNEEAKKYGVTVDIFEKAVQPYLRGEISSAGLTYELGREGLSKDTIDQLTGQLWEETHTIEHYQRLLNTDALKDKNAIPPLKDNIHTILHGSPEAKSKLEGQFFHIADTPQFLKDKGLTGDYFSVKYGVIALA